MALKNQLKHWRHQMEMNQREFSEFLGISYFQYNRYERQVEQPNLITLFKIRNKLKERFPEIKLDDLMEYNPE